MADPRLEAGFRAGLEKATELIRQNVAARTPYWKGGLRQGVEARVMSSRFGSVAMPDSVVSHVMEARPPARWASKMPPPSALEPWVADKLGLSAASPGLVTCGPNLGKPRKSPAWTVAFLIARKIKRRGLQIPLKFGSPPDGKGAMVIGTFRKFQSQAKALGREFARAFNSIGGHQLRIEGF